VLRYRSIPNGQFGLNPIEGKIGQAKTGYGLNRIKPGLKDTSESWIVGIILVLNLLKLAGSALQCLIE
jgi:hypothetical protein